MTEQKTGKDAFFWLGVLVITAGLFDLFANLGDWTEFFWFCPVTSAFLAFALFRRDARIMTMCLVLALPAQTPWVIDFVLTLFGHGLGRTAFLFDGGPVMLIASVITHVLLIPVAFWGVWRLGFHPQALVPGIAYLLVLLSASFFFTPAYKNVNCVFYHCDAEDPGKGYWAYFLLRSLLSWTVIFVANFYILKTLFRRRAVRADNA